MFFNKKNLDGKSYVLFNIFFMKISQRSELVLIRSIPGIFQNPASLKNILVRFPKKLFFKLAGLRARWDFRESCPEVGWLGVPSSLPFFIRLQKWTFQNLLGTHFNFYQKICCRKKLQVSQLGEFWFSSRCNIFHCS